MPRWETRRFRVPRSSSRLVRRPCGYGWFHVGVPCPDLPGLRVEVFLGVVDLAYGKRLVAVLAEPAAHRHRVRMMPEVVGIRMTRVQPEHERGPARRADGTLAVGFGENSALRGEAVEMRRDRCRIPV